MSTNQAILSHLAALAALSVLSGVLEYIIYNT